MASTAHRTAILRGAANQARVAADLFDRGFCVFMAMANFGQGDICATRNGRCLLIEVKTGRVQLNGRLKHAKGTGKQAGYDVLALVTQDKRIVYEPALEDSARTALEAPGSTIAPRGGKR